jgi:hypothetical protein
MNVPWTQRNHLLLTFLALSYQWLDLRERFTDIDSTQKVRCAPWRALWWQQSTDKEGDVAQCHKDNAVQKLRIIQAHSWPTKNLMSLSQLLMSLPAASPSLPRCLLASLTQVRGLRVLSEWKHLGICACYKPPVLPTQNICLSVSGGE